MEKAVCEGKEKRKIRDRKRDEEREGDTVRTKGGNKCLVKRNKRKEERQATERPTIPLLQHFIIVSSQIKTRSEENTKDTNSLTTH